MTAHNCDCNEEYRGRVSDSPWRDALAALASPMVRLHHLRNIRTQMMRDALRQDDGCNARGDNG